MCSLSAALSCCALWFAWHRASSIFRSYHFSICVETASKKYWVISRAWEVSLSEGAGGAEGCCSWPCCAPVWCRTLCRDCPLLLDLFVWVPLSMKQLLCGSVFAGSVPGCKAAWTLTCLNLEPESSEQGRSCWNLWNVLALTALSFGLTSWAGAEEETGPPATTCCSVPIEQIIDSILRKALGTYFSTQKTSLFDEWCGFVCNFYRLIVVYHIFTVKWCNRKSLKEKSWPRQRGAAL